LINKDNHKQVLPEISKENFSYTEIHYQDRRIICTYSEKRAKKDAQNRDKLVEKAKQWLSDPSQYKQVKKRGAGRFIHTNEEGTPIKLNLEQIEKDAKYDGFKAIATTTDLPVSELIDKYADLFEVEHAFRTLKSQLEIRPVFHWTNKGIEGHIAMSFIAYTFLNYLRNASKMQYSQIVRTLDKMQMSEIKEDGEEELLYLRSNIDENQRKLQKTLKIVMPNDVTTQKVINQIFKIT